MIGIRPAVSGLVAVAVAGGAFAGAAANPADEIAARRVVLGRADAAVERLDELQRTVEAALELARRGAARVVSGVEPPGPPLTDAAGVLSAAEDEATAARRAIRAADGAVRALDPAGPAVEPGIGPGEAVGIGAQLGATAPVAEAFAEMRVRAEGVIGRLEGALDALLEGDPDEADRLVKAARTDHHAISAWEVELVTLPVWIETTDALIGDVEMLLAATRARDAPAARAAAESFASRSEDAATADRALRIAMNEGGAAVSAAPLGRLAALLAAIGQERLRMEMLRAEADS